MYKNDRFEPLQPHHPFAAFSLSSVYQASIRLSATLSLSPMNPSLASPTEPVPGNVPTIPVLLSGTITVLKIAFLKLVDLGLILGAKFESLEATESRCPPRTDEQKLVQSGKRSGDGPHSQDQLPGHSGRSEILGRRVYGGGSGWSRLVPRRLPSC